MIIYIPKIVFVIFHLVEDILFCFKWFYKKFLSGNNILSNSGTPVSRSKFLSQVGIVLAVIPFVSLIGGIVKGRFNFKVEHLKLHFPDLPKSFNGLKIVQISDLHIGSFKGLESQVEEAISLINAQEADYLLFTGDLVNNFYDELEGGWINILSKMTAKLGKFSILGNHDYGNYYDWDSKKDKFDNFKKIIDAHAKIGFQLLKNDSVKICRGDGTIALIGVENWGRRPFPQLADYEKASKNVAGIPFKILMSHDPTHWDAKILGKTDVRLTLSGHTHGMQLGIKLGNRRYSPASFRYPRWGGLYREGRQYLYVNRGLGFIGYPGRVGMPPEITVFEFSV
jgi:predicted MPP superfamily phosphohydrolase